MNKTEAARVLKDPDNHFPYARDRAEAAGIPKELIDVSEAVVKAQTKYLENPSDRNLTAVREAEAEAQRVAQVRREKIGRWGPYGDVTVGPQDALRPQDKE